MERHSEPRSSDQAAWRYQQKRIANWDSVSRNLDNWKWLGGFYHQKLHHYYARLVTPGLRVIEIGCAAGDLLAALKPSEGVGVDFSEGMVQRASQRYPQYHFIKADAGELDLDEQFDVIVLSDLVNDLWDVQAVFERLQTLTHSRTRLILNTYNRIWEIPLNLAQRLGFTHPKLEQNWLTVEDLDNLLTLTGFEKIQHRAEILFPLGIPFLSDLANRFLVKGWPFYHGALTHFIIARPRPKARPADFSGEPLVSVIVPARNESGNIAEIFKRTPEMGRGTELIFVEGHSKDDTYEAIERARDQFPERPCRVFKQTGQGKGDAVRLGFDQAGGQVLMILDADLTVPPETLPRFYEALMTGKGEFVNGVRLIYPMEEQAMRFFNIVGNKFFSLAFTWLLGQPIKDTLCGTKVLWKKDYDRIAANRSFFGDFDPFGDFDLLFGAARLNLKIIDLPVRYGERHYGTTNINRWSHGWLLLKMVWFAARRIKFI
ncbi:MAG: glycosyl transferase [Desulfobacca sp.]|nr:glycosyl transferase [Desulfobacca sp.]